MNIRDSIWYLLLVVLVLSTYISSIVCPKKSKGKDRAVSKGSTSEGEVPPIPPDVLVANLKSLRYPCIYKKVTLRLNSGQENKEVLKELKKCRPELDKIIDESVHQLGLSGKALSLWLDIVDEIFKLPRPMARLEDDIRNDDELSNILIGTFKRMNRAVGEIIDAQLKQDEEEKQDEGEKQDKVEKGKKSDSYKQDGKWDHVDELLFRAYYFGVGICVNIFDVPLAEIVQKLIDVTAIVRSSFSSGYRKEFFPDNKATQTGKLLYLSMICTNLAEFQSDLTLLYIGNLSKATNSDESRKEWIKNLLSAYLEGGARSVFDSDQPETQEEVDIGFDGLSMEGMSIMDLDKFHESEERQQDIGSSSETKEDKSEQTFDIWSLRKIGSGLNMLDTLENDPDYEEYLFKLNALGTNILRECLQFFDYQMEDQMEIIKNNEHFKKAKVFIELIVKYINDRKRKNIEDSLMQTLSVRGVGSQRIEVELFFDEEANKTVNLVDAYKTGTGMCELFYTDDWRSLIENHTRLLDIIALLTEVHGYHKFIPRFRHDTMDLFYLWAICRQIMVLPLN